LANQDLLSQQIVDADVGEVVAEGNQGLAGSSGILRGGLDEDVDVECRARIAVDRKGRGADDDVADAMSV